MKYLVILLWIQNHLPCFLYYINHLAIINSLSPPTTSLLALYLSVTSSVSPSPLLCFTLSRRYSLYFSFSRRYWLGFILSQLRALSHIVTRSVFSLSLSPCYTLCLFSLSLLHVQFIYLSLFFAIILSLFSSYLSHSVHRYLSLSLPNVC